MTKNLTIYRNELKTRNLIKSDLFNWMKFFIDGYSQMSLIHGNILD